MACLSRPYQLKLRLSLAKFNLSIFECIVSYDLHINKFGNIRNTNTLIGVKETFRSKKENRRILLCNMIKINAILNYRNNHLDVFTLLKHQDAIRNLEILCVKSLKNIVIGDVNTKSVRHNPAIFTCSKSIV